MKTTAEKLSYYGAIEGLARKQLQAGLITNQEYFKIEKEAWNTIVSAGTPTILQNVK